LIRASRGKTARRESFNGKFRDECLAMEWFRNRLEAKVGYIRKAPLNECKFVSNLNGTTSYGPGAFFNTSGYARHINFPQKLH
jgi:hypothetical protein